MTGSYPLPDGPIVLVGLMGSGKTTVGRLLAARWGVPFLDLDEKIEHDAGMSVRQIFDAEGEAGFRAREVESTHSLGHPEPSIISVGGGWMARPELRNAWPGAVRIWLRVDPAEAARRLAGEESSRPLLANDPPTRVLEELLDLRLQAYRMSDYTVDTSNRTPEEVADAVVAVIGMNEASGAEERPDTNLSTES